MAVRDPHPSKSQVNKAGSRMRKFLQSKLEESDLEQQVDQFQSDYLTISRHRDKHTGPMTTANVSLRNHCKRLGIDGRVTQRLKRMPTILDKLMREPTLALGNMHDLGGVRVVVPTATDVRALQTRLVRYHPAARVLDYVDSPRASGYRAVHVITEWGGSPRCNVEIQLRSQAMHAWADMVERTSEAMGHNYKQDGESSFHQWARALSRTMEATEMGYPITSEFLDEYDRAAAAFFGDS